MGAIVKPQNKPRNIKWYGWKPSLPHINDDKRAYGLIKPRLSLPALCDLRPLMPPVYDQGQLGSCHDDMTEVLTDSGWKMFADVDASFDRLASVNPDNQTLIFERPARMVRFKYQGPMYCGQHNALDFAVTPDHVMVVRKWDEAARTLRPSFIRTPMKDVGWYVGLINSVNYGGENALESFTLKGVEHKTRPEQRVDREVPMGAWLRFLGIYLAEGTILQEPDAYKIQIAASKDRERNFVISTLAEIGIEPCVLPDRFTFENKQIYFALSELGLRGVKAPMKFIPEFVFSLRGEQVKELLLGHFAGDGCEQRGSRSHYTSSKRLADDLQRLVLLSGEWASVHSREPRKSTMKDGREVVGQYPEYRVGVWKDRNLSIDNAANVNEREYDGEVFCAEVPINHTLVTRRNGKILISGNCTGNGIGACWQYTLLKENKPAPLPARLMIYYNERVIEGTVKEDSGAEIHDGVAVLEKNGCCDEKLYPYNINKFTQKPSAAAVSAAKLHLAQGYIVNQTLNEMKTCLVSGFPIVIGFSVYESFESDAVAKSGVVPMPKRSEQMVGGHCVCIVGYSDATKVFFCRNSWGADWGNAGYFTVPYDYFLNPNLASDFWTIRTVN